MTSSTDIYGVPTDAPGYHGAPEDPTSAANLAAKGLRYAKVDPSDEALAVEWVEANNRGFLGSRMGDDELTWFRDGHTFRRWIGVYDDGLGVDPMSPVATTSGWPAELTVPGSTLEHPRTVTGWAISSVTVAPTHRRRGIARELLEGELRTAAALGIPLAMLTVSESTIYGRFGFAPAAMAADWTIDTRRAKWIGPETSGTGRVEFISAELWAEEAARLHDRTRAMHPGQVTVWPLRWAQLSGLRTSDESRAKALRAVRFVDPSGVTTGVAIYRITGGDEHFERHTVEVDQLIAETPAADAALWRFFLEMDLVIELKAPLRQVDEPLRWQIADFRSAKVETSEHQYLRILDVPAVLSARTYAAPGSLVLDVTDPLGFATGRWLLSLATPLVEPVGTAPTSYQATVTELTAADAPAAAAAAPTLTLTVNELAALYLGGVPATTLVDAGRIVERTPGDAVAADRILHSPRAPWLSVWY